MDEYTRLENEIKSYFQMPDVVRDSDTISAYDLYNIINNKFDELRRVIDTSSFFKEIKKNNNILRTLIKKIKKEPAVEAYCEYILIMRTKKGTEIYFGGICMSICKEDNSDELYFGEYNNCLDREFINRYYNKLIEIFTVMEEFNNLFNSGNNRKENFKPQIFSDSFLDVELSLFNNGEVEVSISINSKEDPNNLFNRKWYNRDTLASIIEDNKMELLKKIPIEISSLNCLCKNVLEEKSKVKCLKK